MSTARLGLLGLDNSHPLIDLSNLIALGESPEVIVCADAGPRLDELLARHPETTVAADPASLLATAPDGLIVTLRPSRLGAVLPGVLDSRVPVFLNKPGFTTRRHWAPWRADVAEAPQLMSASVLRFAPRLASLGSPPAQPPRDVAIQVAHGIDHWARPDNAWQADPRDGGGVLCALVYHGIELADAVTGSVPEPVRVEAVGSLHYRVHLRWPTGVPGVLTLDAESTAERYEVRVDHPTGERTVALDGTGEDPFGYRTAMAAFRRTWTQPSSFPPSRTAASIEAAVRAHEIHQQHLTDNDNRRSSCVP